MSYASRARRQRNPKGNEEKNNDAFFGKQHDANKPRKGNSFFQAKLAVNKPGDAFEKEADSVANAVVNQKNSKPGIQQKKISGVQRLATPAEDEKMGTNDARMSKDKEIQEKPIQKMDKPKKEEEKPVQKMDQPKKEDEKKKVQKKDEEKKEEDKNPVQKRQDGNSGSASPKVSSQIENSAGKGKKLPSKTQKEMSSSFGYDFKDVNVHNDSEAAEMNKELNAQAFTHGKDIYFNQGKFNPEESQGKNLLAHELTHVVQQNKK